MRRTKFQRPLTTFVVLFFASFFLLLPMQFTLADDAPKAVLTVFMTNGDRISGEVVSFNDEQVELETKYAGRIRIALAELKAWQASDADLRLRLSAIIKIKDNDTLSIEALDAKEKAKLVNAKLAPTATKGGSKPTKLDPWKRQVNFAYTMTRGNVKSSDVNLAFNVARKRGSRKIALSSFGRYSVKNGRESANLVTSTLRYERTAFRLPVFVETQFEIDRLKNLDYRLSENFGVSYPVLKGDSQQLSFDFGTGLTREEYETGLQKLNATSLLRLKASQKLNEKTLLSQQATFFSDLTDPSAYRVQAEASFTTPLTKHLALRLTGINRYDARPQGFAKTNDFTLLTGFTFDF